MWELPHSKLTNLGAKTLTAIDGLTEKPGGIILIPESSSSDSSFSMLKWWHLIHMEPTKQVL